jgi:F-type H+-transporting ATPase subunit gamma
MAFSTRAIRTKIGSVKNIRKITRAMELVSASKMRRATQNALATREYSTEALNILLSIAHEEHIEHPLLEAGTGPKTLFVVVASNKGLCGGYNAAIERSLTAYIKNAESEEVEFVTIGRRAEKIARRLGRKVLGSFIEFPDNLKIENILGLTRIILDAFKTDEYKSVSVVYANYVSAIEYRPVVRKILPINSEIIKNMIEEVGKDEKNVKLARKASALYLFEPNEEEVLNLILPRLVESVLYQALLESLASEHSARMVAMKNASDNAKNVLDDLTLTYNYARQASVTQEISEISAGANALS